MLLEISGVDVFYGAIHALKNVSLKVEQGSIVTLIGANGAGKSTLLRTISGLIRSKAGRIFYEGNAITEVPPHQIVAKGISHVPEGRRIFANLTVRENLDLGAYLRRDADGVKGDMERVFALFPRLRERIRQPAGTLSGGEQQMLAIGRAIMSRPKLLLMDEPSMGLAPFLVQEIFRNIREINAAGTTILLVEQNAHMALSVAKDAHVLETGNVVLSGPATDLARMDQVRKAYLGE